MSDDSDDETPEALDETSPAPPLPSDQPDAMSGGDGSNWTASTPTLDPLQAHTHTPGDPARPWPSTDAADVQSAAQTRAAVHSRRKPTH
jgi:hypothetical protein